MDDLFHEGEVAIQEATGERHKALLNGHAITRLVPMPARPFVALQTGFALAWQDLAGKPWVRWLEGQAGLAQVSSGGDEVELRLPEDAPVDLQLGQALGLLFIELSSRRRLRVNGRVSQQEGALLRVAVEQAYPNCPKYIQRRIPQWGEAAPAPTPDVMAGQGVPDTLDVWLAETDTLFVASVHPSHGLDCSHRGGPAGFVLREGDTLRIPDYAGNAMFGTLGNIQVYPQAGLCLLSFSRHQQLLLSGPAAIELAVPGTEQATGGTNRWWRVQPEQWRIAPLDSRVNWDFVDYSPFNP
ncbi:pyridoxamine 5'-phosphate oxidase family protein [Leeia aquatica]|uniref:Pyridoxamine 5'-phosphate oxidase n=1 Tax=Leeia aquatica TaxID=2725557 RepID=A0A847SEK4_9NEIS|nr:pyridoxamine 5'-phosphate oxidase family protein [Leeia aquatica]NLR74382.1 pyridoxamine 5'-phosphate oxidase [Leeia aquatica]